MSLGLNELSVKTNKSYLFSLIETLMSTNVNLLLDLPFDFNRSKFFDAVIDFSILTYTVEYEFAKRDLSN